MNTRPRENGHNKAQTVYHASPAETVIENVSSSPAGLAADQVDQRLSQYGPNRLPEPPKRSPFLSPKEPLLNHFLSWRIVSISTTVNTLIFFQIFYLFNARYLKESALSREGVFGNPTVLLAVGGIAILQMLFTYLPIFNRVFGPAAIPAGDWIRLISFTFSVFILVEIEKMIIRRLEKTNRNKKIEKYELETATTILLLMMHQSGEQNYLSI